MEPSDLTVPAIVAVNVSMIILVADRQGIAKEAVNPDMSPRSAMKVFIMFTDIYKLSITNQNSKISSFLYPLFRVCGKIATPLFFSLFSSHEPKAQVSFSNKNLSVVRRRCRLC